jgi:hypothetical protein
MSTMNSKQEFRPQLAEADLVKVAGAENQAEAELVQGLLLEEGVRSSLRRAPGFDVPDFLAAGPRDVLVAASDAQVARDVLPQPDLESLVPASAAADSPRGVFAGVVIAVALVALLVWLGTEFIISAQALHWVLRG